LRLGDTNVVSISDQMPGVLKPILSGVILHYWP